MSIGRDPKHRVWAQVVIYIRDGSWEKNGRGVIHQMELVDVTSTWLDTE